MLFFCRLPVYNFSYNFENNIFVKPFKYFVFNHQTRHISSIVHFHFTMHYIHISLMYLSVLPFSSLFLYLFFSPSPSSSPALDPRKFIKIIRFCRSCLLIDTKYFWTYIKILTTNAYYCNYYHYYQQTLHSHKNTP